MKKTSTQRSKATALHRLVLGHGLSIGLGVLLAVLAHSAATVMGWHSSDEPESSAWTTASAPGGAPAPWGTLETTSIVLDRPDEFYKQNSDAQPGQQIEWLFENYGTEQLTELIDSCELSDEEKTALLDRSHWRVGKNGILVAPPVELVRDINASARERLYTVLAKSLLNVAQHYPLVYDLDGFERVLSASRLPSAKLDLLRKLTYVKDGFRYFCDGQVFELLSSPDEGRMLMGTLSRVPTLLVRLRLNRESDIEGLVRYWATSGREATVRRLLTAVARTRGGTVLNINHLLPPLPRLRLYTYPAASGAAARKPDCFWTAMNFFSDQPDDRFYDADFRAAALRTDYKQVSQPAEFGDLLFFYRESAGVRKSVHMCNYIADDIVFTKNGTNYFAPWVLMKMPDMLARYTSDQPLQMAVFRHKH
jgi:hypothetical protein